AFFLEIDRATLENKRWREKVQAYQAYTESGKYTERYGTTSLRILTVTTGQKRLSNLKRTTEAAGGGGMFWFTTLEQAQAEQILTVPVWQVAGQKGLQTLK
ncbi:MAG: replication-relaxation family protein, partial [Deltaproteobacteria bacterium]|nr:replication-relaxation family protein [Deltaproteobacteria bacterium]